MTCRFEPLLLRGDARALPLTDQSVQCVVTSPPYWGLRDYGLLPLVWGGQDRCEHQWGTGHFRSDKRGVDGSTLAGTLQPEARRLNGAFQGQWCLRCSAWRGSLGLEPTPGLYVQHLVEIFREVRRVLRDDGTVWLNLGDSYAASPKGNLNGQDKSTLTSTRTQEHSPIGINKLAIGLKPKDLVGIPWRVAFALQADGWHLRSDIIFAKPNPMPESVRDRPTRAHEYLFLLSKSERYYYDATSIAEPVTWPETKARIQFSSRRAYAAGVLPSGNEAGKLYQRPTTRNRRSVWVIPTQPYKGAHFATFPEKLVEPCILAGCPPGGIVLDPFVGSGTVCAVATRLGRRSVGVDLKPEYLHLAVQRISGATMVPLRDKRGQGPRQYAGFNERWRQRGRHLSLLVAAARLAARWR